MLFNRLMAFFILVLSTSTAIAQKTKDVKVFQINVWQEGTVVPNGFNAIIDEIIDKDADVVVFSEVRNYNNTDFVKRILESLKEKGRVYYGESSEPSLDVALIAKFPIIDQEPMYKSTDTKMGNVLKTKINIHSIDFLFYSVHLDYTNYACYLPRGYDGVTWKKLEAPITDPTAISAANKKGKRDEAIEDLIKDIEGENKEQFIVVAGDFNEPSHLDWTKATKDLFDHRGAIVPWDCSILLQRAGFKDAFRKKYPNPVTHPGFTFPSANPAVEIGKLTWAPTADERDRIDYIYFRPYRPIRLKDIKIVGPEETIVRGTVKGKDSKDKFLTPKKTWPTDHKALLATFTVY